MSTIAELTNEIKVYNLSEVRKHSKRPIRVVSDDIREMVEPFFPDENRLDQVNLVIEEITKDADVHGNHNSPIFILASVEVGHSAVMAVFNEIKKKSKHNRLGKKIISAYSGSAYTYEIEDNVYRGRLDIGAINPTHTTNKFEKVA